MSVFIPATAVENVRALAHSALPSAPVLPDHTRRPGFIARLFAGKVTAGEFRAEPPDRASTRPGNAGAKGTSSASERCPQYVV
jgi:hypothetical protein